MSLIINSFRFATAGTIVTHPTLSDGLIHYYKCDANGSFPDEVGSDNGTINGATYTASGKINGAYDYDGTNDYVAMASLTRPTTGVTISAWVKADGVSGDRFIFGADDSGAGPDERTFLLRNSNDDIQFFWLNIPSFDSITATGSAVTGSFIHVVATYDQSSMRLYVNGSQVAKKSNVTYAGEAGNGAAVGAQSDVKASSGLFDGIIDEVGLWNRALTGSEIPDLYNSGDGLPYD